MPPPTVAATALEALVIKSLPTSLAAPVRGCTRWRMLVDRVGEVGAEIVRELAGGRAVGGP